jgi:hypothetical protein
MSALGAAKSGLWMPANPGLRLRLMIITVNLLAKMLKVGFRCPNLLTESIADL